jgi:hypothetical protein
MSNSVLPHNARFSRWVFVLLGLSAITVLVVLNLSRIIKWGQGVRRLQDRAWRGFYQKLAGNSGLQARDDDPADDQIAMQDQGPPQPPPRNGEV